MVEDFLVPRFAEGMGVDGELIVGFHIDEAGESAVVELEFGGIEQMKEMDAETAVEVGVERAKQRGGIGEKIG